MNWCPERDSLLRRKGASVGVPNGIRPCGGRARGDRRPVGTPYGPKLLVSPRGLAVLYQIEIRGDTRLEA